MKTPRFRRHRTHWLTHEEKAATFGNTSRSELIVVVVLIALVGWLIAALMDTL